MKTYSVIRIRTYHTGETTLTSSHNKHHQSTMPDTYQDIEDRIPHVTKQLAISMFLRQDPEMVGIVDDQKPRW